MLRKLTQIPPSFLFISGALIMTYGGYVQKTGDPVSGGMNANTILFIGMVLAIWSLLNAMVRFIQTLLQGPESRRIVDGEEKSSEIHPIAPSPISSPNAAPEMYLVKHEPFEW